MVLLAINQIMYTEILTLCFHMSRNPLFSERFFPGPAEVQHKYYYYPVFSEFQFST
jgi:hypothetical protein